MHTIPKSLNVNNAARAWQHVMWLILTGYSPMFYPVAFQGTYMLVDGLQNQAFGLVNPLRVGGDYPKGSYTFHCLDGVLNGLFMTITVK